MATPQPGIFALGTRSHAMLEFVVDDATDLDALLDALVAGRSAPTAGGVNVVVGFGPALWSRLAPAGAAPEVFAPFAPIEGLDGKTAPSTQRDLWIWVHGTGEDTVFDASRDMAAAIEGACRLALVQPCFVYRDSRDMTGFIDGTANPPVQEAPGVACVADGEPGEGGAFVITQRWVHDLAAFHALAVADQERVFGRSKPDSIEMGDDVKPATAHIARAETDDEDGEEVELFRRSVPYGTVSENGLYFVAFAAEQWRFDLILSRMFGTSGDGLRDALLDYTRPVTGSYWFAPSMDALNELLDRPPR